ncbi:hypothetical protein N7478_010294 [Penicillium angulare]|uniref:uncharacterized protein n=1 Tax=Penicillium angulare TaxID=116970 RepID=UPI002540EFB7|nr:uncharacterized protein N7478_010294 [Penicillium angulare]KAJ5267486.1 hypothetical protein N7478_010294 [Penicillium angulare]
MAMHPKNELLTTLSWPDYPEELVTADESSSQSTNENAPSENTDDYDFVISDEATTEYSSSVPDSTGRDWSSGQNEELGQLWPIKAIAVRRVKEEGSYTLNYLVLWGSWEEEPPRKEHSIGTSIPLKQVAVKEVVHI